MDDQHRTPRGNRGLTPAEIALVNEAREIEAMFMGSLGRLRAMADLADPVCVSLAATHAEITFIFYAL